jgi:acetyltransferase-like isoleucine patch superfamily enzyme
VADNETKTGAEPSQDDYQVRRSLFKGGAVARYRELVLGEPGLAALIRYESILLASSWVPGALGLALRKILYPMMMGGAGGDVVFGQNVTVRHPRKINLGSHVVIDDQCMLDAKGANNRGIEIHDGVFVGRNTILSCKNGDITLEDGVNIGFNCEVFSGSKVTIGRNTLLAGYCYVIGGGHEFDATDRPVQEQRGVSKGITIGEDAWLGAGTMVLDGVTIGSQTVIGAGSLVTSDLPPRSVAAGTPARVLRSR